MAERSYRHFYAPLSSMHPDFVEGVAPFASEQRIEDVDFSLLADAGVEVVLLDWDHTLVANDQVYVEGTQQAVLHSLLRGDMFREVHIATSNGTGFSDRLEDYQKWADPTITQERIRAYQPQEYSGAEFIPKWEPAFWERVLADLDMQDTPEKVAMVGDSHIQDVHTPQQYGLYTVLLERYMRIDDYTISPKQPEHRNRLAYMQIMSLAHRHHVHPEVIDPEHGAAAIEDQRARREERAQR